MSKSNTVEELSIKPKNEKFYVNKRGLIRKADALKAQCNSEIFLVVYQKDMDKIYTHTTNKTFTLQRITELILKDVQEGAFLKKNNKFEDMDWDQINRNVENIASVGQAKHESSYPSKKGHENKVDFHTHNNEGDDRLHTNQFTSLTSEGAGDVSASISVSENHNMDTALGKFQKAREPVFHAVPTQR